MKNWYYPLRWLIIILLGLALYGQTFGFNFVFDDFDFIVNNPYIKRFDHVHYMWRSFPTTRTMGFYSFAFNYSLGQLNPEGYHIFNFIIHLIAVGLVWACSSLLFKIAGCPPQELPFIIALLFLVHPCQTQAVSYISQRFESMATVFYLGCIYFYLRGRVSSFKTHRIILFACSLGSAILGIFTKEVAATIPLMILALEFILLNKKPFNFKELLSWQMYLLISILGLVFVLLFMKMVRTNFIDIYLHFSAPSLSHDGDVITGGKYVLTQLRVFLTFLRLLILPINQNLDYDYPLSIGLLTPPLTLVGLCVIGIITFLIFKLRKKWPLIAFGLAWVLISFSINTAPRINVIFEHKLYLISFGFFLAAVCALSAVIKDPKILTWTLVGIIAVLSLMTFERNQVWRNQLTIWEDVAQKSPHKIRAFNGLGVAYDEQGNLAQAMINFNKAIAINPAYSHAYNGLANVYSKQGDVPRALLNYNKAIILNPYYADAYYNRGIFYDKQKNLIQALSDYNKAIQINPDYAEAHYNRANTYNKLNNTTQALADYDKAIEDDPYYEKAYVNRGNTYSRQGNFTEALSDYNKAIAINPKDIEAYINRATCFAQEGSFDQALSDYNLAIAINPLYTEAYYDRAVAYFQLKQYDQALEDVKSVETLGGQINPEFLKALKNALPNKGR